MIAKEQIEEAANLICGAETFEGVGFKVGARWALEQVTPRWIPVEEALPEPSDTARYLVYLPLRGYGDKIFSAGFYDIESGCWPEVTHWQPLPEPPTK